MYFNCWLPILTTNIESNEFITQWSLSWYCIPFGEYLTTEKCMKGVLNAFASLELVPSSDRT